MGLQQITWLMLVLNIGAVFRLSILVTQDKILDRPRTWFVANYHGMLVTLIQCPWCISVWFGIAAALLTWFFWMWWAWVALVLTLSAATGFLAERV